MEVSYNGNMFKITITTNEELRIKIPGSYKDTDEANIWICLCQSVLEQMKENNFSSEFTLRSKARLNENGFFNNFVLRSEHGHSKPVRINEFRCQTDDVDNKKVIVQKFIPKETE